jgi:hypothetical protein
MAARNVLGGMRTIEGGVFDLRKYAMAATRMEKINSKFIVIHIIDIPCGIQSNP